MIEAGLEPNLERGAQEFALQGVESSTSWHDP